jgi:hypothetical protein
MVGPNINNSGDYLVLAAELRHRLHGIAFADVRGLQQGPPKTFDAHNRRVVALRCDFSEENSTHAPSRIRHSYTVVILNWHFLWERESDKSDGSLSDCQLYSLYIICYVIMRPLIKGTKYSRSACNRIFRVFQAVSTLSLQRIREPKCQKL